MGFLETVGLVILILLFIAVIVISWGLGCSKDVPPHDYPDPYDPSSYGKDNKK